MKFLAQALYLSVLGYSLENRGLLQLGRLRIDGALGGSVAHAEGVRYLEEIVGGPIDLDFGDLRAGQDATRRAPLERGVDVPVVVGQVPQHYYYGLECTALNI